ncbi:MAG: leucine-rich repeat domain-containing protein, partial [Candidatus Thorarchaeota archaeon]
MLYCPNCGKGAKTLWRGCKECGFDIDNEDLKVEAEFIKKNLLENDYNIIRNIEIIQGKRFEIWDEVKYNSSFTLAISNKRVSEIGFYKKVGSIEELFDEIKNLDALKSICLRGQPMEELPESITKLKNLEKVYLDRCHFETFPPQLCKLTSLTELHIKQNDFTSLPTDIDKLKSLKFLDIEGCELKLIPESFGDLDSLENLNLKGNKLEVLPESFG